MSRISFILLPVLMLTAFASFVPPVRGAPASFTPTATNSRANTPTSMPSPCSISEKADFTKVAAGRSVEGAGLLAHDLNIDAAGTAVKILAAARPVIYSAHGRGGPVPNGGIAPGGGFSDIRAHTRGLAHHYTFTFPPTVTICNFSLHMLDFGDFNPSRATDHFAVLRGYDWYGRMVATQTLRYTTPPEASPRSSNRYGNLRITGDALTASAGKPGNWTWKLAAPGIVRVTLDFGKGFDPNIGFDALSFTIEGTAPTTGLILRGHVTLPDGSGLAGVNICRSYAGYGGVKVATTDKHGAYESPFDYIPGDETVHVWALAAGYNFDPPFYLWEHYHSVEDRTLDFGASSISATSVPPVPCSP